ncbi:zinc ribbon domain-containing protein [Phytohabitans rumicis]|uniref:Zinc ribbon domain-containing protein n=1 Tax=Phytohabitans rumicis TaxID=1076125 RepID=A0A6V8KXK8_9ACTN|nr:zinc ribbon domain-containing protein [Phytohabitans rumicis]GFJ86566.1 hypothetical protein Prum_002080 [Phytohabitans rumicis]
MNPLARRVSCPYCYHRIDGRRLWYQCTGRGSPGKAGCTPVPDPERERETGVFEPSRPAFAPPGRGPFSPAKASCATCGSETGIRVCPCCHTPLSTNFGGSASPLIAMVGAKGTGKTVYLHVLAHELLNGTRRRFDADVRASSGSAKIDVSSVMNDRALFAQTAQAIGGRRDPFVFEWRRPRRVTGYETTYLSFYDTAGEDLTNIGTTHDLAYLGAADALILLLDPFMIPHARDQISLPDTAVGTKESTVDVVNRVTETLRAAHGIRSSRNIKLPIAVAFAKIDAFFDLLGPDHPLVRQPAHPSAQYDDVAGQATHEHVRALLHSWEADDIDAHLRYNYANFRYFAVSSLGAAPDYDARAVHVNGVQPFRVDEPLVWLLSQFGVVRRGGA